MLYVILNHKLCHHVYNNISDISHQRPLNFIETDKQYHNYDLKLLVQVSLQISLSYGPETSMRDIVEYQI